MKSMYVDTILPFIIHLISLDMKLDVYEVLVGNPNGLRWEPVTGRLNLQALRYQPVEGGNENDGTPLYIVKAPYKGFTHPGKTSEKLDGTPFSRLCIWA